jgi:hypothetical protein
MSAKVNNSTNVKIQLNRTVTICGVDVDHVIMREPTVDDFLQMNKRNIHESEKELFLFADLLQIAPDDIRKLPIKVYMTIQGAFKDNFLS